MPCAGAGDTKLKKDLCRGEDARIIGKQFDESVLILEAAPRPEAG